METRPPQPRAQSAAIVLPLLGVFLLMPPFISLFAAPVRLFGIPLVVLYMFAVWAALVLATWWLARRLGGPAEPAP